MNVSAPNAVCRFSFSEDGNVFIGTSNGILRYDNYAYILINSENSALSDNHITSLVIDKNNSLWIGTYFGGLVSFQNNKYHVSFKVILLFVNFSLCSALTFSLHM